MTAEAAPGETLRAPRPLRTTIGSPEGLHLPGIMPEPDVVESEAQMGPAEQAILDDLREALGEDALERPGEPGPAPHAEDRVAEAPVEPAEVPRLRASLPWWYAAFRFWALAGMAGLGAYVLVKQGRAPLGLAAAAASAWCVYAALKAGRNRAYAGRPGHP